MKLTLYISYSGRLKQCKRLDCSLGNFGSNAMSSPGKSASGGGGLPGPNGSAPAEQVGVNKPAVGPSIAGPSRRHCTSPPAKSFLRHSFRKVPHGKEGKLLRLQGGGKKVEAGRRLLSGLSGFELPQTWYYACTI